MSPERRVRLERRAALIATLLGALLIGLWHPGERGPFWQGMEGRLLDARFLLRGPLPPPEGVAIVAFDDAAIAQLDAFPPSRTVLSKTVAESRAAGAQVLALDFLMVEPRADDVTLAAALSGGAAVLAVAESASVGPASALHTRSGLALVTGPAPVSPLPAMGPARQLQAAADLGHVAVQHAPDGVLRRMLPVLAVTTTDGVAHIPGLAVAAVAKRDGREGGEGAARYLRGADGIGGLLQIGKLSVPLDLRGTVPLNFYGPAGSVPTHSAASVTSADLRGKIVFLGATAIGFGDRHASPFDATLPGVELHATFAANLLAGQQLRRDAVAWLSSVSLALLAALAGFMAAGLSRPAFAALAIGLAAVATAAALHAAYLAGWWLDASTVLLSLALGVAVSTALQQFTQRRRATNLARYQSPALVESLATLTEPLQHRAPQPAVVVFVDVAAFTTYAERSGAQGTHAFLGTFTRLVAQAADSCGGLIADFAGDGAMVVFGVPERGADDVERALRFVEQLYALVDACQDWPGLKLRASAHAGPVQLGILGGERHRRVSVSGDVVNTASRLLEFARASDASLALSGALVAASPAARHWAERVGLRMMVQQPLRGREAVEEVWIGHPPEGAVGSG